MGGVVTIVGEAGMGDRARWRTSKLSIVNCQFTIDNFRWIEGRCLSYGAAIPYLLWLDLLRSALGVTLDEAPELVRDRLQEWVQALCLNASTRSIPTWPACCRCPWTRPRRPPHRHGWPGAEGATFGAVGTVLDALPRQRRWWWCARTCTGPTPPLSSSWSTYFLLLTGPRCCSLRLSAAARPALLEDAHLARDHPHRHTDMSCNRLLRRTASRW